MLQGVFISQCPKCGVRFGYVVKDHKVTCLLCNTSQELPIIKTGNVSYACFDCEANFTSLEPNPPCPVCHINRRNNSLVETSEEAYER